MAARLLLAALLAFRVGAFVPTGSLRSAPAAQEQVNISARISDNSDGIRGSWAPAGFAVLSIAVGFVLGNSRMAGSRAKGVARGAVVYSDPFPKLPDEPEQKMSAALPYLKYPAQLEGWVGGEKGFDPLSVTDALPVYLVREAELKHGRVCMLATVGWIATDLGVRFPGEMFQNVSTVGAHDAMVKAGLMQPFLGFVGCLELYGGFLLLQGLSEELPREAGDFFLRTLMPADKAGAETMKLKELENGRLAMLAFSGIATAGALTGKAWPFL
mmetsp:Transcript_49507/g.107798  ORF Transcript_49507/g.107798 Transcript_49507/m.107798 type:complete len:271 (-) Transcript_49507:180-992(-)|eukprot:CAMPEP_0170629122 /NCGR_PEP_ID=MMETSP0224-20130122/33134_1 /TAXON_ID=285029 /ORGANISM="Togula jolla, Strain CCCM 725" /LENGTH=270 /DNA_ID=CAMNT_0010956763 /DNA_START=38 /DNA_END=850 /DNA_ORIENTATION=+